MKVSVIINVHSGTQFSQFRAAAESVLGQDYEDIEFIIVVSDAPQMLSRIQNEYGDLPDTKIVSLDEDNGLSPARNAGARAASGDIVVFTDDDVIADSSWISELIEVYEEHDPVGVGGHVNPIWPDAKPWYLPAEFYWLVGVTHRNFVSEQKPQPVRNTFGCNISFEREAFLSVNGFREDLGKNQKNPLQGEEAELCNRIQGEFWYTPDAMIHHKVDREQLAISYLLKRSFWQGYSKAALRKQTSDESLFLTELFLTSIPQRLLKPSIKNLGQAMVLLVLTLLVGIGFSYGIVDKK